MTSILHFSLLVHHLVHAFALGPGLSNRFITKASEYTNREMPKKSITSVGDTPYFLDGIYADISNNIGSSTENTTLDMSSVFTSGTESDDIYDTSFSYSIHYKQDGFKRRMKSTRQTAQSPRLTYYGGPVIANVKVVTIWWGGTSKVQYTSQLEKYYGSITKSDWYRIFAQYSTSSATIGPGRWIKSFNYSNAPRGTVSDTQIRTSLRALIVNGYLPPADGDTYYAIHFAPGINISIGPRDISCETYCAYHTTMWSKGGAGSFPYIYYGVIPDQGGGCSSGCGNDAIAFNNLCSVASHELAEVVTDPAVGLSYYYSSPLAWYSTIGGEIADICNAYQGTTLGADGKTYTVQSQWSNKHNRCIANIPLAPTKRPTVTRTRRPVSTPTKRPSKEPVNPPTKRPTPSPTARRLLYYGGPVIASVKVVLIWWGPNVQFTKQLEQFYGAVTKSKWFEIMLQYSTSSMTIGQGTWLQSYNFSNAPVGKVTDNQIETSLRTLISKGYVPPADKNTYYAIHFAPGTTITSGTAKSCVNFCAYHRAIQSNAGGYPYIFYGAIPDFRGDCASSCRKDPLPFNNLCSIASRALSGTVTNPLDVFSNHYSAPAAWLSSVGEIGGAGLCSGTIGTTLGTTDGVEYTVMKLWSNKDKTCLANAPSIIPTGVPTSQPSSVPTTQPSSSPSL